MAPCRRDTGRGCVMGDERCPECRHRYAGDVLLRGCWCDCHHETPGGAA
jgi:hypothetical protein